MKIKILFFSLILFLFSCSPARFVEPLEKGEVAAGINLGGPLIHFSGKVIPIPFSSVFAGYGLKDGTTVYSGLHLTSAAFKTFQMDIGIAQRFCSQEGKKPGVTFGGAFNVMAHKSDFRLYPSLDVNAFWNYHDDKWMTYLGSSAWLDFYKNKSINEDNYHAFLPEFHLGQTLRMRNLDLTLEYKLLDPFVQSDRTVAEFSHFSNKGASGIYFSVVKHF